MLTIAIQYIVFRMQYIAYMIFQIRDESIRFFPSKIYSELAYLVNSSASSEEVNTQQQLFVRGNAQFSFDICIMLSDGINAAEGFPGNLVYIKAKYKILQNRMLCRRQRFDSCSKIRKKL